MSVRLDGLSMPGGSKESSHTPSTAQRARSLKASAYSTTPLEPGAAAKLRNLLDHAWTKIEASKVSAPQSTDATPTIRGEVSLKGRAVAPGFEIARDATKYAGRVRPRDPSRAKESSHSRRMDRVNVDVRSPLHTDEDGDLTSSLRLNMDGLEAFQQELDTPVDMGDLLTSLPLGRMGNSAVVDLGDGVEIPLQARPPHVQSPRLAESSEQIHLKLTGAAGEIQGGDHESATEVLNEVTALLATQRGIIEAIDDRDVQGHAIAQFNHFSQRLATLSRLNEPQRTTPARRHRGLGVDASHAESVQQLEERLADRAEADKKAITQISQEVMDILGNETDNQQKTNDLGQARQLLQDYSVIVRGTLELCNHPDLGAVKALIQENLTLVDESMIAVSNHIKTLTQSTTSKAPLLRPLPSKARVSDPTAAPATDTSSRTQPVNVSHAVALISSTGTWSDQLSGLGELEGLARTGLDDDARSKICDLCKNTTISAGVKMRMMAIVADSPAQAPDIADKVLATMNTCRENLQKCNLNPANFAEFEKQMREATDGPERNFLNTLVKEIAPRFEDMIFSTLGLEAGASVQDHIIGDQLKCGGAQPKDMKELFDGMGDGLTRAGRAGGPRYLALAGTLRGMSRSYDSLSLTIFEDDSKYFGEFKDDLFQGHGAYLYGDGDGDGDGDKYFGGFNNNLFQGNGTYLCSNGDKYFGEFKNDKFEGAGTFLYEDGRRYDGEFQDDKFEGTGTYLYEDGSRYDGEFSDGKRHGVGVLTDSDGNCSDVCYIEDTEIDQSFLRGATLDSPEHQKCEALLEGLASPTGKDLAALFDDFNTAYQKQPQKMSEVASSFRTTPVQARVVRVVKRTTTTSSTAGVVSTSSSDPTSKPTGVGPPPPIPPKTDADHSHRA